EIECGLETIACPSGCTAQSDLSRLVDMLPARPWTGSLLPRSHRMSVRKFDRQGKKKRGQRLAGFLESQGPCATALKHVTHDEIEATLRRNLVSKRFAAEDAGKVSRDCLHGHLLQQHPIVVRVICE